MLYIRFGPKTTKSTNIFSFENEFFHKILRLLMSECSFAHKARLTRTTVSCTILWDEHVLITAHEYMLICSKGPFRSNAPKCILRSWKPRHHCKKNWLVYVNKCIIFGSRMFFPFWFLSVLISIRIESLNESLNHWMNDWIIECIIES